MLCKGMHTLDEIVQCAQSAEIGFFGNCHTSDILVDQLFSVSDVLFHNLR